MPSDNEYRSADRMLRLQLYLMTNEATREEICQHVTGYDGFSESAQRRLFERDLKRIEFAGFVVSRKKAGRTCSYHIELPRNFPEF